ncbi:hypothetical protein BKA93DRAFT_553744 [Sparassis latifolia]
MPVIIFISRILLTCGDCRLIAQINLREAAHLMIFAVRRHIRIPEPGTLHPRTTAENQLRCLHSAIRWHFAAPSTTRTTVTVAISGRELRSTFRMGVISVRPGELRPAHLAPVRLRNTSVSLAEDGLTIPTDGTYLRPSSPLPSRHADHGTRPTPHPQNTCARLMTSTARPVADSSKGPSATATFNMLCTNQAVDQGDMEMCNHAGRLTARRPSMHGPTPLISSGFSTPAGNGVYVRARRLPSVAARYPYTAQQATEGGDQAGKPVARTPGGPSRCPATLPSRQQRLTNREARRGWDCRDRPLPDLSPRANAAITSRARLRCKYHNDLNTRSVLARKIRHRKCIRSCAVNIAMESRFCALPLQLNVAST